MITQEAAVVAIADGTALIEVPRRSGCSGCGHASSCGTSAVAKLFGNGSATRLRVSDHLGLAAGERVVIGIHNRVLLRASLAVYLLPLVALLAGAGGAEAAGLGDTAGAATGVLGLFAGLWIAELINGGTGAGRRFRPVLLRRATGAVHRTVEPTHPTVAS